MEKTTIFNEDLHIYKGYNEYFPNNMNKLFCTFIEPSKIDESVELINQSYNLIYKKIFILSLEGSDELICTYNTELGNVSNLLPNTILVHRKKESNTLYTINALNELIMILNGNKLDTSFPIIWQHYKNSLLLTQSDGLKMKKTKIYKIIEL